jgi:putative FmdB family regulatory protein
MSNNKINYNNIHHVNQIMTDSGAIYTLSNQGTGDEMQYNYIHDYACSKWADYGCNGLHLDEKTSGCNVLPSAGFARVPNGNLVLPFWKHRPCYLDLQLPSITRFAEHAFSTMPLFDFQCSHCGELQELLVLGSKDPVCRKCGSAELRKLISLPAPVGKSAGIVARARQRAAAKGHLSNYSSSERRGNK